MTPTPTPTPLIVVANSHDLYDWMKDIVLPSLGILATVFVGVVAVVVSVRLGRRELESDERRARAAVAAVAERYLRTETTEEEFERAALGSGSPHAMELFDVLKLVGDLMMARLKSGRPSGLGEARSLRRMSSAILRGWVHEPTAAIWQFRLIADYTTPSSSYPRAPWYLRLFGYPRWPWLKPLHLEDEDLPRTDRMTKLNTNGLLPEERDKGRCPDGAGGVP